MKSLETMTVKLPEFNSSAGFDGRRIAMQLGGQADLKAREALGKLLGQLHSEALRLRVREVLVNMHHLDFMNSSCFKSFITWINQVQDLDKGTRYQINFISNPAHHWQARSLQALKCFAVDLVSITESGPSV